MQRTGRWDSKSEVMHWGPPSRPILPRGLLHLLPLHVTSPGLKESQAEHGAPNLFCLCRRSLETLVELFSPPQLAHIQKNVKSQFIKRAVWCKQDTYRLPLIHVQVPFFTGSGADVKGPLSKWASAGTEWTPLQAEGLQFSEGKKKKSKSPYCCCQVCMN